MRTSLGRVGLVLVGCAALAVTVPAQDAEQQAQQMLRVGLRLMSEQNYSEAVKELAAVADSYPTTAAAPVANLRLAEYYFETTRDFDNAHRYLSRLTTDYRTHDSAAMGYVLLARLKYLKQGERASSEALGDLRRAQDYFENHPEVAAARYYEAELHRIRGRVREASEVYRNVALTYRSQIWAARALLGEARCLVALGRGAEAFIPLQRVRDRFPGTVESAQALNWNGLLYRLYLRVAPPYRFSGRTLPHAPGKLKGVRTMLLAAGGTLYAGGNNGSHVIDLSTGHSQQKPSDQPVRAYLADVDSVREVLDSRITGTAGQVLTLRVRKEGGDKEKVLEELRAAVRTQRGELLVADGGERAVLRFSPANEYLERYDRRADRLAIDPRDTVAVLSTDDRSVTVLGTDGKPTGRVAVEGGFKRPVDIAYDALGHLYVLDRGYGGVFVFSPSNLGAPLAQFVIPQKTPGAFFQATAFAVEPSGGLFIYDAEAERIQIYR